MATGANMDTRIIHLYFDLINAKNAEEVGRYWAEEAPDAIDEDMTAEEYGQQCVEEEGGVFTKHGYVYQRFDTEDMYAGIIVERYKIADAAIAAEPKPRQKEPKKPKSVLDALDKGKEKVAQADAARVGQNNKPPKRKRGGQEQGD